MIKRYLAGGLASLLISSCSQVQQVDPYYDQNVSFDIGMIGELSVIDAYLKEGGTMTNLDGKCKYVQFNPKKIPKSGIDIDLESLGLYEYFEEKNGAFNMDDINYIKTTICLREKKKKEEDLYWNYSEVQSA